MMAGESMEVVILILNGPMEAGISGTYQRDRCHCMFKMCTQLDLPSTRRIRQTAYADAFVDIRPRRKTFLPRMPA